MDGVCGICKIPMDSDELIRSIIVCEACSVKFHTSCINLSENHIAFKIASDNIRWMCDMCSNGLSSKPRADSRTIAIGENMIKNRRLSPSALSENSYAKLLKNKKIIIPGVLVSLALLLLAFVLGMEAANGSKRKIVPANSGESKKDIPINATIGQDNVGGGTFLRIVPRDGWLAQPPVNPWVKLDLPVSRIIILPTRTSNCDTQAACTYTVRFTQTFYIESQQQDDIIYNFMIGGDGNVYEGRGWDNRGSAVIGFNDDSITLAFIGSFNRNKPSDKQMNVTKLLLDDGVRMGKISSDYRIVGANKLDPASTTTSADALYKSFEDWPHWSDK